MIDFGTAPTIDTSSTTPAVGWSTVLAGSSSGPSYPTVNIPSLTSTIPLSATSTDVVGNLPNITAAASGQGPLAAQPTSTNWLSALLGGHELQNAGLRKPLRGCLVQPYYTRDVIVR